MILLRLITTDVKTLSKIAKRDTSIAIFKEASNW